MLEKFREGLAFGAGFGIAFVVVWFIAAYFFSPMVVNHNLRLMTNETSSSLGRQEDLATQGNTGDGRIAGKPFDALSLDEKIRNSTVIALARYEPSSDGKVTAVIKEFLKKKPGVTIYYKPGEEFPAASYYPTKDTGYGDGVIIFFMGSPASMKMSMTYSGNRITGLGDVPLKLFRKKCQAEALE